MFTGKVSRAGSVAIRRYIQDTLRRKNDFVRYTPFKRSAASKESGLHTGRNYDHRIRWYYERVLEEKEEKEKKKKKKKKGKDDKAKDEPPDERMLLIIHHIEKTLGITIVATQVPVSVNFGSHKLDTRIDLVGMKGGAYVVIELKCSEQTLTQHEQSYHLPCSPGKWLANMLPDTENVQNQLQTAFGVLGLRNRVSQGASIKGRVVYSTTDAVRSYECAEKYIQHTHFQIKPHYSLFPKHSHGVKAEFLKMPEDTSLHHNIVAAVESVCKGFTEVLFGVPCAASFFVKKTGSAERAVIGILHDPLNQGTGTSKYSRAREHMRQVAKKSDAIPIIVRYTNGAFTAHRIRDGKVQVSKKL